MLVTAVFFFLLAGFLGTFLLRSILKKTPTYKPVVFMHGIAAGIALFSLVTYVALGHTSPLLITSLMLFVLAALGGLTMLTFDTTGKSIPKMLAMGHPILGMISFILLIIYVVHSIA